MILCCGYTSEEIEVRTKMDLLHDLCQRCVTDFLSLLGSISVVVAKCRLFSTVAGFYTGVRGFISRPGDGAPWLTFLL
jgi:hypothetical protein